MSGVIVRFRPDAGYRVYVAAREQLGCPSRPGVIARPCPWCGADPYRPCTVRATGKLRREPHEARQAAP
jgi:hypothetical protein